MNHQWWILYWSLISWRLNPVQMDKGWTLFTSQRPCLSAAAASVYHSAMYRSTVPLPHPPMDLIGKPQDMNALLQASHIKDIGMNKCGKITTHTHTYMYIYIYKFIHTYTHTHTHFLSIHLIINQLTCLWPPSSVLGILHRFPTRGARSGHDAPDSKGDCDPESLPKQHAYVWKCGIPTSYGHFDGGTWWFWVPYVHHCSSIFEETRSWESALYMVPLFLGSDAVPLLFPG